MKDYKHLVNKLDRQREYDVTRYQWEECPYRKLITVACEFIIVSAVILACFIGWVTEL